MKIRYKEECNNIFALVGSPRIDQEEVEAVNGILRLVAKNCSYKLIEELPEQLVCSTYRMIYT